MKSTLIALSAFALLTACGTAPSNNASTANTTANSNATAAKPAQTLSVVDTPQRIKDMMASRGEQDSAAPTLKFVEPREGSTVNSSTVRVSLELSGDLKGYKPMKDPATQMGNHVHVILDNQPYEAYYEIGKPFELRNVSDGEHTIRVFPSRPWHESYKNEGAFQMVRFTVKNGGADPTKPTTTASGNTMANANSNANTAPTPEGKDMKESKAGAVDAKQPLLTYSRPKGEYKAVEADPIMIDFWLTNAKLTGDGGQYRVRYSVDGGEAKFIDKWAPIWLTGWTAGTHSIKLELVDANGNLIDNGGYNSTTREITVVK
jgi:uncharacterized cupredoxin-like copper-binding protein